MEKFTKNVDIKIIIAIEKSPEVDFQKYGIWKSYFTRKYSGIIINPKDNAVAIAAPIAPYFGISKIFNPIFDNAPIPLNRGRSFILFE